MRVLFVCEGNSMRSPMAEAFYNHLTGTHDATSAGAAANVDAAPDPAVVVAMDEVGIDVRSQCGIQLTPKLVETADRVVLFPTPYMPDYALQSPKAEPWEVTDPWYKGSGAELVRQVRDDIRAGVGDLIASQEKA